MMSRSDDDTFSSKTWIQSLTLEMAIGRLHRLNSTAYYEQKKRNEEIRSELRKSQSNPRVWMGLSDRLTMAKILTDK